MYLCWCKKAYFVFKWSLFLARENDDKNQMDIEDFTLGFIEIWCDINKEGLILTFKHVYLRSSKSFIIFVSTFTHLR